MLASWWSGTSGDHVQAVQNPMNFIKHILGGPRHTPTAQESTHREHTDRSTSTTTVDSESVFLAAPSVFFAYGTRS
jgi:hypothetical protein